MMMMMIFPYQRIHLLKKGSLSSFILRDSINSKISFEELLKNNTKNNVSKNGKEKIYYNSNIDIND